MIVIFGIFATVLVFSFRVKAECMCPVGFIVEGIKPPQFNQTVYKKSIKEDTKTITIFHVKANNKAKYQIVKGTTPSCNSLDTFGVSTITGAVSVNGDLNYDILPRKYTFPVKAFNFAEHVFSCVMVEIDLLDVNDNKPKISSSEQQDYHMPENTNNFTLKLNATDADAGGEKNYQIRYYIGNDYKQMFELNEVTGILKIRPVKGNTFDREKDDRISITITLKDQEGLVVDGVKPQSNDDLTIYIRVKDENDNAPQFTISAFSGHVQEDKSVGHKIVKIFAIDRDLDTPIRFTIDSGNDDGLFHIINKNSTKYRLRPKDFSSPFGTNTSAWIAVKKPLDFEKKDKYVLKIKADDNKNPAATATVTIKIIDANDEVPVFSNKVYKVRIKENLVKGTKVKTVSATDKDKVSTHLVYSLDNKAKGKLEIDNTTGVITTGSVPFDYEKEPSATFTVRAFDGKNTGTAVIECIIEDMNDNPPYFIGDPYKFEIKENMLPGTNVGIILAKDRDVGADSKITFYLLSNADERFSIHKDTGLITSKRSLDRELKSSHQIVVKAQDSGNPPFWNSTTVTILVLDVNDNGPKFNQSSYCGKVHEEDAKKEVVVDFTVSDPDTQIHSCPCKFAIVNGSLNGVFKLNAHADKVSADIYKIAGHKFDYEKKNGQKYRIWISAADRGNMKSYTYVDVDVIDINDNAPKSGGTLELLINAYKGKFKGGVVGRPYIIDDDKGDNDHYNFKITKQVLFTQNTPVSYFSTKNDDAKSKGGIVAQAGIPAGKYQLNIDATERNRPGGGITVSNKVTITVRAVSEKAVDNSVALRMTGLNHLTSCNRIRLPDFAKILSEILEIPEKSIVVFSAQKVPGLHLGVDVRFAILAIKKKAGFAGDDPVYEKPINLIPLLSAAKKKIEEKTGGKVMSVGIDACASEKCKEPTGFCFNKIIASSNYTIVTDDNGIVPANSGSESFLSIDTRVDALCGKGPPILKYCPACLNGGKCENNTVLGHICRCPFGFDGPECQATTISFTSTDAYIWLKPLNYFIQGVIALEFLTKQKGDGLILYQGPISSLRSDFIALYLKNGQVCLTMTQGDPYIFHRCLDNGKKLNDGVYHSVKISKKGKVVTLTVDDCDDAVITESWDGGSSQSRHKCEFNGNTTGDYSMINGLNPLQLGGMKPKTVAWPVLGTTTKSFINGCIRRLVDNGVMYDFAHPVEKHKDAVLGCSSGRCNPGCINGICVLTRSPFKCSCLPGYIGATCALRVKSYHYTANSFSEYKVLKRGKRDTTTSVRSWYEKYKTNYLVQVRTKSNGIIVYEASDPKELTHREFSILEIANQLLTYRVNLGDKETKVEFPKAKVDATDGNWRNVTVDRVGNFVKVTVEEGGKVSAVIEKNLGAFRLLDTDGKIFTGGLPKELKYPSKDYDMQGCLGDNRFGGINLDDAPNIEVVRRKNVKVRCPCPFLKCLNGGYCMAGSPPYCICPVGYSGATCQHTPVVQPLIGVANATMGTAAYIIIACIMFIFILAMIFISLLVAGKFGKKKVYITLDDDMKDNIMPYNDEGAGDDDFHNYDLEKLLSHANQRPRPSSRPPVNDALVREDVEAPLLSQPLQDRPVSKFIGDPADTVDVARFITTRVGDADTEDAAYPHDTMLHYGYEGEGSDVEDLSEIDSDGEESDDDADYGFLSDWGAKFDNLDKLFNPEDDDDEDV